MRSVASLIVFLVVAFAAAAFGALFPPGDWYAGLAKPEWTPPNWLFGPVWTALYVMIGISGWLLWRARDESRTALVLWCAQLVLNALWSWIFFGLHSPGAALVEIVVLWLVIAATVAAALRTSRPAAWLLVPYLAWVGFASVLNAAIWRLN
jgi:tryptophan-rich sensory protein